MIRVADYIMDTLAKEYQVKDIFMVSGGGSMHMVDALGRHPSLKYIANHHEQACAIGAQAYARVVEDLGVCLVTTGPGGTNTITGLFGAWTDSIPMLFISGQVKRETLATDGLRQLGDQEADLVSMAKPITKYATMIDDPMEVRYHLEKAIFLAKNGRPGPVWLDIPLDIQSSKIDPSKLRGFPETERKSLVVKIDKQLMQNQVIELAERLKKAERPVLFVGNGIRLAGATSELQELIKKLQIPVLSSFNGMDLVGEENPYFFGRPGTIGWRSANFILQNSDLFISLGSRLNIRIISYNQEALARQAHKVVVDIDQKELHKKTIKNFDTRIQADALEFIKELDKSLGPEDLPSKDSWLKYCHKTKTQYPQLIEEHKNMQDYTSCYYFVDKLSEMLGPDAVVTMGDGMACVVPYKSFKTKFGQRLILNSGCAAMGYGLPAAVGACFGHDKRETICLDGDGSIMMNLQELQTIVHHNLPVKIFVLDNDGYLSIRTTQDTYFGGNRVGSGRDSGVSCPDFIKVAQAFGLDTAEIKTNAEVKPQLEKILGTPGPLLCVVRINPTEQMLPKLSSEVRPDGSMVSKPLEDLFPFLPRDQFRESMIIPTYNE